MCCVGCVCARKCSKLPKEVQDEIEEDERLMRLWSGWADNGLCLSACVLRARDVVMREMIQE